MHCGLQSPHRAQTLLGSSAISVISNVLTHCVHTSHVHIVHLATLLLSYAFQMLNNRRMDTREEEASTVVIKLAVSKAIGDAIVFLVAVS